MLDKRNGNISGTPQPENISAYPISELAVVWFFVKSPTMQLLLNTFYPG